MKHLLQADQYWYGEIHHHVYIRISTDVAACAEIKEIRNKVMLSGMPYNNAFF